MTREAPDLRWLAFLKIGLGYLLLISVVGLSLAVGLGHVEEKTSFGFISILNILSGMAGGFSVWAFTAKDEPKG
jgi:hypothetical protein